MLNENSSNWHCRLFPYILVDKNDIWVRGEINTDRKHKKEDLIFVTHNTRVRGTSRVLQLHILPSIPSRSDMRYFFFLFSEYASIVKPIFDAGITSENCNWNDICYKSWVSIMLLLKQSIKFARCYLKGYKKISELRIYSVSMKKLRFK